MSLHITFMCVLYHTQICRGQEGKKNCPDFIVPDPVEAVQVPVSVTDRDPGTPCMPWLEQPCSAQQPALYPGYPCPAACTGLRPGSATHLAPNTSTAQGRHGTARGSSLGLHRGCRKPPTNHLHQNQLRAPHFITDTHTRSPFYLGFAHGFRIRICW